MNTADPIRNCLILDDSPPVRRVAGFIIGDLGFAITEAASDETALGLCRNTMPDVVLLDGDLPENGAISFITALRSAPGGAKPVIVVCIAERDMRQITEAGAAGANSYLLKPFDAETIRAKFNKLELAA